MRMRAQKALLLLAVAPRGGELVIAHRAGWWARFSPPCRGGARLVVDEMRGGRARRLVRRRHEGQALVFVGLVLLFLVPLLLVAVEAAARGLHRQQVEDALQQATRSAAQTFSYGEFAQNDLTFRSEAELIAHARQILIVNLRDLEGLAESPDEVAKLVKWEVLPNGGTCVLAGHTAPFGTPTVCATLAAPMKSIAGLGDWDAHLVAAASLDHIR